LKKNILRRFINNNKVQIFKFIIVGIFSSILNFLVYKSIYIFTAHINFASFLGYCIGLLNSFLLSRKWVFSNKRCIRLDKAFIKFVLIYALGGLEMVVTINFLYKFSANHIIAWLCGACLAAINNFLFSKYLIFKN
tara:strand:- start:175 stop:582 length:408 start_codon:yes stop_codon:yes gene_type:complete